MKPIPSAIIIITIVALYSLIALVSCEGAEYTDNQIANAIYKAEGSEKAKKPYGILSVACEGEQDCRQICLNTIRNQRKRHAKHTCNLTYLECLAKRYAPVGVENDPRGLNKNWLKNVKYFLNRR